MFLGTFPMLFRVLIEPARAFAAKNIFYFRFIYTNYLDLLEASLSTRFYVWRRILRLASDSDPESAENDSKNDSG
jgi:hypothetical protein